MRALAAAVVLILAAAEAGAAQSAAPEIANPQETVAARTVHLRGLDTLNGTTEDLDLRVGETITYGHLEITVEACRVPRGEADADAEALLSIRDIREADPRFKGWMFAASPALSSLDHPRYDVWVLGCDPD